MMRHVRQLRLALRRAQWLRRAATGTDPLTRAPHWPPHWPYAKKRLAKIAWAGRPKQGGWPKSKPTRRKEDPAVPRYHVLKPDDATKARRKESPYALGT